MPWTFGRNAATDRDDSAQAGHQLRERAAQRARAGRVQLVVLPGIFVARVKPTELQALLEERVHTPVRGEPYIDVEEIQPSEVVMRVAATPEHADDGARLADEILEDVGGAMATA